MVSTTLEPGPGKDWQDQCRHRIERLKADGPDPLKVKPTTKPIDPAGCYKALDLVTSRFHYTGKGRDVIVAVRAQRIATVHLLRAMLDQPSIQVSGPLGSYRSCELQAELYEKYIHGDGHLVAPPGGSFHNRGISFDLYRPTVKERAAMKRHGFEDLLPQDPPHFTYGHRG